MQGANFQKSGKIQNKNYETENTKFPILIFWKKIDLKKKMNNSEEQQGNLENSDPNLKKRKAEGMTAL